MEEPSSPRAASSGTSSLGKRCSSKQRWMIGSTFSSTSRATESCTMRSSSVRALRTSNRSSGSSLEAEVLAMWYGLMRQAAHDKPWLLRSMVAGGPVASPGRSVARVDRGADVPAWVFSVVSFAPRFVTLAQEPPRVKIPEILIVETIHQPGSLASVLLVIAEAGLAIEHLTALRRDQGRTLWEITLEMDEEADRSLYDRIDQLPNARFVGKSDRVFNRHRGGKIKTVASLPINTLQVLRDIYTPGVARVCLAIKQDPQAAHDFTNLDNTVAIVTNGTAVLGLGNIGPLAGLPVMEGKAALFADLVGISGVPILLTETRPDRIVDLVASMELSFGAIQLEDIAAPECFEIEQKMPERISNPALHDDHHGTAATPR